MASGVFGEFKQGNKVLDVGRMPQEQFGPRLIIDTARLARAVRQDQWAAPPILPSRGCDEEWIASNYNNE